MSLRHSSATIAVAIASQMLCASMVAAWAPIDPSRPVWSETVHYELNRAGSADLDFATSESEVRNGMEDWTRVSCTSLTVAYDGTVSRTPRNGDGFSTVSWVESGWRYDSNAIGVTIPMFSRAIVEADMELNGVNYTWTTAPGRRNVVNAYSIVLHEAGHFYGLDHSSTSTATMYASYSGGRLSLQTDDQNGICALYPRTGMPVDCTTTGCPAGQECQGGACVTPMGDGLVCSPCSRSGDCTAGVCLRYPDGIARCGQNCTSSSQCGTNEECYDIEGAGGQCIRFAGESPSCDAEQTGCRTDAECAASDRCNTLTRECEPRPTVGGELGAECTSSVECRSGLCFAGVCSQSCDWLNTRSCPSGWYCSGEATGRCTTGNGVCVMGNAGAGELGASCSRATDCASLYCANGACGTPCIPGGASGCGAGLTCQEGATVGCGFCGAATNSMMGDRDFGEPCNTSDECRANLCTMVEGGSSICSEYCDDDGICPGGFQCVVAGEASVCVPDMRGVGVECTSHEQCIDGLCASVGDTQYCTRECGEGHEGCPRGFECAVVDPSISVCRVATASSGCGCRAVGAGGADGGMRATAAFAAFLVIAIWRRRRSGSA
jgi:hypothetical protein